MWTNLDSPSHLNCSSERRILVNGEVRTTVVVQVSAFGGGSTPRLATAERMTSRVSVSLGMGASVGVPRLGHRGAPTTRSPAGGAGRGRRRAGGGPRYPSGNSNACFARESQSFPVGSPNFPADWGDGRSGRGKSRPARKADFHRHAPCAREVTDQNERQVALLRLLRSIQLSS